MYRVRLGWVGLAWLGLCAVKHVRAVVLHLIELRSWFLGCRGLPWPALPCSFASTRDTVCAGVLFLFFCMLGLVFSVCAFVYVARLFVCLLTAWRVRCLGGLVGGLFVLYKFSNTLSNML